MPLPDFDWATTEPIKQRPFKAKYHLTMGMLFPSSFQGPSLTAIGLTNSSFSELIQMDKTYLSRLKTRKQIMQDHRDIVLQASSGVQSAVDELYVYLTSTYLPRRFPTMFSRTEEYLENLVTGEKIPLVPNADAVKTLELLGENVDEDFLILLPSEDGDGYTLKVSSLPLRLLLYFI